MSTKRGLITVLAVSIVLLALGIGSQLARAQPHTETLMGMTISNPGRLNDTADKTIPGKMFDFAFTSNEEGTSSSDLKYIIEAGTVAGGDYQLTTLCWHVSGIASSGSYSMVNLTSSGLWGNCCCIFLPTIEHH